MNHAGVNPQTAPEQSVVAIIPARFASTRLPGKALMEISGKPMICWVVERALAARNVRRVIVATDDERILDVVQSSGYEVVMTRKDHPSGTDRLAEVAASLDTADIIVNVQGDEPLISPETIDWAVDALLSQNIKRPPKGEGVRPGEVRSGEDAGIVTTWEPMKCAADVLNPDVVKVVVDQNKRALYFSRLPVPYPRDAVQRHGTIETALRNEPALVNQFRKHTGLYVYRRDVLLQFTKWPQSALERNESLEQLRALEQGVNIKAIQASAPSIGVDTMDDLERVRREVSNPQFRVLEY